MVKAHRIRRITLHYEVEFDNEEEPPIIREAEHEINFKKGMKPGKAKTLKAIKILNEGFEDFFNENVEDNS